MAAYSSVRSILILDEPTAVLTTQETVELFKELRHLKEQGYTIVFISHKLNEIMEITDRLTIMRGGRSMGVYNTCDVTKEEISRLMVGRDVILNVQKDKAQPSDVVLRVRDVEYVNEWHKKMLDKIDRHVRGQAFKRSVCLPRTGKGRGRAARKARKEPRPACTARRK